MWPPSSSSSLSSMRFNVGFWNVLFLMTFGQMMLTFVLASNGASDPLHSVQVRVAQCRAQCLDKFTWSGWTPSDILCQEQPDCFMCWESCDLLNQNFVVWGAMCNRKDICFPGCQQACGFYVHGTIADKTATPVFTLKFVKPIEFGVQETSYSLGLTWSKPEILLGGSKTGSGHENNVVYVVVRRTRIGSEITKWQQVTQTSEMTTSVDAATLSPSATVDFKVIAVTGAGMAGQLVTSYHVASGLTMPQDGNKKPSNGLSRGNGPSNNGQVFSRWRLHLVALSHNPRLGSVDAIVTWASPGLTGNFLVTWEVKEGTFAITGHLYTDSTTVSLTLWPETVYSVQVELVSSSLDQALRSEPLTIDTNVVSHGLKGRTRLLDTLIANKECSDTFIIACVAIGIAMVILFVGFVMVIRRCKRKSDHDRTPLDVQFKNNGGLRRSGAIRRKLSILSNGPIDDVEAVLSPRPINNSPNPSTTCVSSLDERLSAFRAFLENVEKMATETMSPKPNNNQSAFVLPDETKVCSGTNPGNLGTISHNKSTETLLDSMEDDESNNNPFETTRYNEKLIVKKKQNARRCMSTAI